MEKIKCFKPIYNNNSKVLILGSMPSVKSLKESFYYMHPTNRFWRIISEITKTPFPQTVEKKKKLLLDNGIALWDVIYECQRQGSLDSAIRQAVPNDLYQIPNIKNIKIFTNGKLADKLLKKHFPLLEAEYLPSTSSANVMFDEKKWERIKKYL